MNVLEIMENSVKKLSVGCSFNGSRFSSTASLKILSDKDESFSESPYFKESLNSCNDKQNTWPKLRFWMQDWARGHVSLILRF